MAELITPGSVEEAADFLTRASINKWRVQCAGAQTRFYHGNKLAEHDYILSAAKLNRVAEYETADLVIGVEAGATLPQIASVVQPNNQFLALDPAVADASTIGGVVATSAAGPMRFAHGTPRDQVLGLEMISADGRLLHFGGRVVKNVAGYDVVRLVVGSRGTLGFITKLHLRLKPLPQSDRTIAIEADSFGAVAEAVDKVLVAHMEPVALEILSGGFAGPLTGSSNWTALLRFQGNPDAVAAALAATQSVTNIAHITEHDTSVWTRLAALEIGGAVKIRFANLRSHVRETVATALRVGQELHCVNARLAVHAGEGIARLVADDMDPANAHLLNDERKSFQQQGGSLIVESPSPEDVDAYGHHDGVRLMTSIKKIFDPQNILGGGRFSQ
jgi:glycolate oxidase FAD binding subunit